MAKTEAKKTREALLTADLEISQDSTGKIPTILFTPAYSGGLTNLGGDEWPLPVVFDLAGVTDPVQNIPILKDHEDEKRVGQTTAIDYTPEEINAQGKAVYLGIDPAAEEVITLAKRGVALQASIRTALIAPADCERFGEGETVFVNNRTFDGPVEVVRKFSLREISIVTLGADKDTSVSISAKLKRMKGFAMPKFNIFGSKRRAAASGRRSARCADENGPNGPNGNGEKPEEALCENEEFLAWLESLGFDPAALTEEQLAVLAIAFGAAAEDGDGEEEKKEGEADDEDGEEKKEGEADDEDGEEKKEGEADDEDEEQKEGAARNRGWIRRSARTRTAAARLLRAFAGPSVAGGGRPHQCRVAEAALIKFGGASDAQLKLVGFTDAEIDAANTGENQRLTPSRFIWRSGALKGADWRDVDAVGAVLQSGMLQNRLNPTYQAGQYRTGAAAGTLSNSDLPNVLMNTMHKEMLIGFKENEDPTDKLSKVGTAVDKRGQLFWTLNPQGKMEQVRENGELTSLEMKDTGVWVTPNTYGNKLKIGYDDIVNDNQQALADLPQFLGRFIRNSKQDIWWNTLAGKLGGGAGKVASLSGNPALSLNGLNAAFAALKKTKDENGHPLVNRGKYLVCTPASEATALNIQNGQMVVSGTAPNGISMVPNNLTNQFETVASAFLGTGSNIPTAKFADLGWLLMADPTDLPLMIITYLNGAKEPTMKTVPGRYEVEGIEIGIWWTFGIGVGDVRAACYSSGAGS
ncbi:MAG: hypothetical protein IJG25_03520 [Thermoguttaceae bacterium]|nr:hypothetical protein [Thermoguttaceae bacterium]